MLVLAMYYFGHVAYALLCLSFHVNNMCVTIVKIKWRAQKQHEAHTYRHSMNVSHDCYIIFLPSSSSPGHCCLGQVLSHMPSPSSSLCLKDFPDLHLGAKKALASGKFLKGKHIGMFL